MELPKAEVERLNNQKIRALVIEAFPTESFSKTRRSIYFAMGSPIAAYIGLWIFRPANVLKVPIAASVLLGSLMNVFLKFSREFKQLAEAPTPEGIRLRLYFQNISKGNVLVPYFGVATRKSEKTYKSDEA